MAGTGYSRSPRLLKGALIQFSAPMLVPIPNIIVFQYNPESLTRTLTPWTPPEHGRAHGRATDDQAASEDRRRRVAQPYDPAGDVLARR